MLPDWLVRRLSETVPVNNLLNINNKYWQGHTRPHQATPVQYFHSVMRCVLQVRFYDQELGWEAWAVFGPNDVHKQVGSPTVTIDHILSVPFSTPSAWSRPPTRGPPRPRTGG